MKNPLEVSFQKASLEDVMNYYAKGFDLGVRELVKMEYWFDPVKKDFILQLMTREKQ